MKSILLALIIHLIIPFGEGFELPCKKSFTTMKCTLNLFNQTKLTFLSKMILSQTQEDNTTADIAYMMNVSHRFIKNAKEFKENITFRTDAEKENGIYLMSESIIDIGLKKFICIMQIYKTQTQFKTFKMEPILQVK
ncbi:hypothetical protein BgiBS90_013049, partial [Biomphalaria glabrata]